MRIHCSRPHLEVEVGPLANTKSVGTLILNLASSMVRSKFLLRLNFQAVEFHSPSVNKLAQSADGLCGSVKLTEALVAVSRTVLSWFSHTSCLASQSSVVISVWEHTSQPHLRIAFPGSRCMNEASSRSR